MTDIVVTWPKTRTLEHYLGEVYHAQMHGLEINYRVSRFPTFEGWTWDHDTCASPWGASSVRCYMVHDGLVRGSLRILYCCTREPGEVKDWPAGKYIVRSP